MGGGRPCNNHRREGSWERQNREMRPAPTEQLSYVYKRWSRAAHRDS